MKLLGDLFTCPIIDCTRCAIEINRKGAKSAKLFLGFSAFFAPLRLISAQGLQYSYHTNHSCPCQEDFPTYRK